MRTFELVEVLFEAAGDHGGDLAEYRDDDDSECGEMNSTINPTQGLIDNGRRNIR